MRIAFLTHQFPGVRMGGLGSYTVAAARALATAGHDVHVFTLAVPADVRRGFEEDTQGRVKLHAVPDLATRVAAGTVSAELAAGVQTGGEAVYRLGMGSILEEAVLAEHGVQPFDVVEAPEFEGLSVPLMLSLRQSGEKLAVVAHIHSGSAISRGGNQQTASAADRAIDALEAAAILLADGVVAMTQAVVRETKRALGLEREAELIPLAVPRDEVYSPPRADGPVLFVGRLERLKGVDVLIEAAGEFLKACPQARVRFVGPDTPTAPVAGPGWEMSMRGWMEQRIPAELRGRIEFTGELTAREVTAEMRGARFLALPSTVENFSLVAAQGLGMGRTCVFSAGIGTAEIYGDSGVSFPHSDARALARAMIELWNDEARVQRLSRGAWERAEREFERSAVVRRQVAFYERTMEMAAKGRRDLSGMPAHLSSAMIEPLAAVTRFACGIKKNGQMTPGQRLLAIMERIAASEETSRARVVLYGVGRHSARLLTEKHVWQKAGHEVVGFIDDGARWAQGGEHLGLPVMTRGMVLARLGRGEQIEPIVLSTDTFETQFWEQTRELRERGVPVFRLYGD